MYGVIAKQIVKDSYRNDLAIQNVSCPTLIIHGDCDDFVKIENSVRLFGLIIRKHAQMLGDVGDCERNDA